MLADTADSIARFINSPPGQLAAGGVLAGAVWKLFELVDNLLKPPTKLEIADWLSGVTIGPKVKPWPQTFAKVFDRVFGAKHLSWKCFWRSCLASYVAALFALLIAATAAPDLSGRLEAFRDVAPAYLIIALILNVLPDYISLLETRYATTVMSHCKSFPGSLLVLCADFIFTGGLALLASWAGRKLLGWHQNAGYGIRIELPGERSGASASLVESESLVLWVLPAFFTSIWLWLYAGSGFLLRAARDFDVGFKWFNEKFDIQNKPLQAIGLVAAALVALVYWAVISGWYLISKL